MLTFLVQVTVLEATSSAQPPAATHTSQATNKTPAAAKSLIWDRYRSPLTPGSAYTDGTPTKVRANAGGNGPTPGTIAKYFDLKPRRQDPGTTRKPTKATVSSGGRVSWYSRPAKKGKAPTRALVPKRGNKRINKTKPKKPKKPKRRRLIERLV